MSQKIFAFSPMIPSGIFAPFGIDLLRDYTLNMQDVYHSFLRAGRCENPAIIAQIAHDKHISTVIYTTACDQMRHLHDLLNEKGFLFNVPTTCGKQATQLYFLELQRLLRYLTKLTNRAPTQLDFEEAFNLWYHQHVTAPMVSQNIPQLLFLGSPLFSLPFSGLQQILTPFNLLNYSETGRFFANKMKFSSSNVFEKYAQFYGSGEGFLSPFRRPNESFYTHLKAFVLQYNIQGLLLNHTSWCDQWQGVATHLHEMIQIPQLSVVVEPLESIHNQRGLLTRLEAFKEQLLGGGI